MKKDLTLGGKKKYKFKPKLVSTTEPTYYEDTIEEFTPTNTTTYTPITIKPQEKISEKEKTYELNGEVKEMKFIHDYDPQVIYYREKEVVPLECGDDFLFEVSSFENDSIALRLEDEVLFEVVDDKAKEIEIVKQMYFIN